MVGAPDVGARRAGNHDLLRAYDGTVEDSAPDRLVPPRRPRGVGHVADAASIEEGTTNETAVGSRDQVAMAVGMVSVHLGVPVEDAWVRLRAYAFRSGEPLAATARAVLEGRLRLT